MIVPVEESVKRQYTFILGGQWQQQWLSRRRGWAGRRWCSGGDRNHSQWTPPAKEETCGHDEQHTVKATLETAKHPTPLHLQVTLLVLFNALPFWRVMLFVSLWLPRTEIFVRFGPRSTKSLSCGEAGWKYPHLSQASCFVMWNGRVRGKFHKWPVRKTGVKFHLGNLNTTPVWLRPNKAGSWSPKLLSVLQCPLLFLTPLVMGQFLH